ncbi:MAG TPA: S41 family peptidase [Segetibacter sp.]|jgi:hypothetical protein
MKNNILTLNRVWKSFALAVAIFLLNQSVNAQENVPISEVEKQAIFKKAITLMYENYIFPEGVNKIEAIIKKKFASNGFKNETKIFDFLEVLNKDFESLGNDHHLNIFYGPSYVKKIRAAENSNSLIATKVPDEFIREIKYENFFLKKAERMDGNIGYFEFNKFEELKFSKEAIAAAMNFISNSSAIIVNLSQNGGGSAETVHFLMNYFLPDSTRLGQFKRRISNEVIDIWTAKDPVIKKIPDSIPLYIVVSKSTSSAAEAFAYGLQQFKRAIIIGEQTRGEGNPGKRFVIDDNLYIMVPTATNVNIVTGTSWEATGVTPNIKIPSGLALTKATFESYTFLANKTSEKERKQLYNWMISMHEAQLNPQLLSTEALKAFTGDYGEGKKVSYEDGSLYFINKSDKYKMTYMNDNTFIVEGKSYRLKFPHYSSSLKYYEAVWVDGGTERTNRVSN